MLLILWLNGPFGANKIPDAGEAARRIAQPGGLFPACTNTLKRGGA